MNENKNKTLVPISGLSTNDVEQSKQKFGTNKLSEAKYILTP